MTHRLNTLLLAPLLVLASLCCSFTSCNHRTGNGSMLYHAQYQGFHFTGYEGEIDTEPMLNRVRASPDAQLFIKFSEDSAGVSVAEIDVALAKELTGSEELKPRSGNKDELVCVGKERFFYFDENSFLGLSVSVWSDVLISPNREGPYLNLPISKSELIRLWGKPDEWSQVRARGYF